MEAGPAERQMGERLLTVDLGNSRLKARSWRAPQGADAELEAAWEGGGDAESLAALGEWVAERAPIERIGLSAVGSRESEQALTECLRSRSAGNVEALDPGLELRVRSPWTIGSDRLFAARGAVEHIHASALVVDAGTALTVDAVWLEQGAAPAFLGGAIAPGPALLARSLASGTARLQPIELRPGCPALGRDTREAIEAGVVVGFEGAAARLIDQVGKESGIRGPIVLTGGAAIFLTRVLGECGARVLHVPDLVHHGLLAALGTRPPIVASAVAP